MFDRSSPFLHKAKPLEPKRKNDFAEERLRSAILWCELEPGEVVSEVQLVERFSLGRAATRAALLRLAADGLVQSQARHGWQVQPISGALIGQVIAARRLVEPVMAEAKLDAKARTFCEERAAIIASLDGQSEVEAVNARRQYCRDLDEFVLSKLNPLVRRFLQSLWDQSERIVRFLEHRGEPRFGSKAAQMLVAALAAEDRDAVLRARTAEIDAFESFVVRHLLNDSGTLGTAMPSVAPDSAGPRNTRNDKTGHSGRRADGTSHHNRPGPSTRQQRQPA